MPDFLRRLAPCLAAAVLHLPAPALADAPTEAQLERATAELSQQLRCVVCQNQTIADSQAELALDLRRQVRSQLAAGRSEQEVLDYMVQRYGDFVLYKPPLRGATVLLWAGPAALVLLGLAALARTVRRQASLPEEDQS